MNLEKDIKFANILVALFTLILPFSYIMPFSLDVMHAIQSGSALICLIFGLLRCNRRIKRIVIILGSLFSALMLTSIIYNGNARVVNLLWIWGFLGVAMILYQFGIKKEYAKITFYIIILFFIYQYISGTDFNDVITNGSPNGISLFCIFAMVLYYIPYSRTNRMERLSYIPPLIAGAVCLWAAIRSAVLSLGIFFILILIYNIFFVKSKTWIKVISLVFVMALIIVFLKSFYEEMSANMVSKINREGGSTESPRTLIWIDYFYAATKNIGNFIFGPYTLDPSYINLYIAGGGNTHNSFLMLHSKYGIVGFLITNYYLFISLLKSLKVNKVLFLLIIVTLIRASFDWMAFPGSLDVLFWYFILYAIDEGNSTIQYT